MGAFDVWMGAARGGRRALRGAAVGQIPMNGRRPTRWGREPDAEGPVGRETDFFRGFVSIQRYLGLNFLRRPLVAAAAIAGEGIQHAVEFSEGMYVRGDGIAPGHEANVRLLAAGLKVAGFLVTLYWTAKAAHRDPPLGLGLSSTSRFRVALAALLIPVAIHYLLNYSAVGRPSLVVVTMVLADCIVVAWLAMSLGVARVVLTRSHG